ncbi:MAG: cupin domain-containing protein [Candidatus Nanopelagicales bacterium]
MTTPSVLIGSLYTARCRGVPRRPRWWRAGVGPACHAAIEDPRPRAVAVHAWRCHARSSTPPRPPGQGPSVWSLGGRFTIKLDEAASEAWYVLDGHMTFYVGDDALEAPAGTFAYAPMGLPHTFTGDVGRASVRAGLAPVGVRMRQA